jgi:hypothetical protein
MCKFDPSEDRSRELVPCFDLKFLVSPRVVDPWLDVPPALPARLGNASHERDERMERYRRSCVNQRGDTMELEGSDGHEAQQRFAKQGSLVLRPAAVGDV